MTEVMRIKAMTIKIQGLTVELGKAVSRLRSDGTELIFRLTLVQQSQDRIEENTVDIKKGISQADAKLDTVVEKLDRLYNSGIGKQQNESQETKASVSEEFKRRRKLGAALGVDGVRDLNRSFYERIRDDRVKGTTERFLETAAMRSWLQGEIPFVVVSGETGNGKTFIASRIIEQLTTAKSGNSSLNKAVAYFFCRKGPSERNSVILALKTMAYDIAFSDKLFAKHLSDLVKERGLQSVRTSSKTDPPTEQNPLQPGEPIAETSGDQSSPACEFFPGPQGIPETSSGRVSPTGGEVTDKFDELVADTAGSRVIEANDTSSVQTSVATVSEEIGLDPKLRRVSTAVLHDIPLDEEDGESAVWDIQRHWEKLFVHRPKSFDKHVYLVIDGLDECDATEAIALCAAINASAGAAVGRTASKMHVLLLMKVDRATMYESHALTAAKTVYINPGMAIADIDCFVRKRISSAWQKKLVRKELREASRKAVIENCNSNFLKASLLVNEVTSLSREDVVRGKLSDLPNVAKTLQSAMMLVIKRLSSQLEGHDREDFHVSSFLFAC